MKADLKSFQAFAYTSLLIAIAKPQPWLIFLLSIGFLVPIRNVSSMVKAPHASSKPHAFVKAAS
jgi:hypothetical protein